MVGTLPIIGIVSDKDKMPVKKSSISVIDNKTPVQVWAIVLMRKGAYYLNASARNDYNISYEAEGFFFNLKI